MRTRSEPTTCLGYLNGKQMAWLSMLAFLFLYINLGSVCSHCLYNAATAGRASLARTCVSWAVILGAIGIAVAAGNVWAFFIQWLSLLGILVPPIGAIILIDQYVFRPNAEIDADWAVPAHSSPGGSAPYAPSSSKSDAVSFDCDLGRRWRERRLLHHRQIDQHQPGRWRSRNDQGGLTSKAGRVLTRDQREETSS